MNNSDKTLTGKSIGGYRILDRIGRGGMADVYLGFHDTLRRHAAIKILKADLVASDDHRERFLREARSAAALVHPNIVQVYDIGEDGGVHFIAQEYVCGSNLRQYIAKCGTLPPEQALSILAQAVAALKRAEKHGIVHRDIKPENILLNQEGEAKIADFGLARGAQQDLTLTEVGITLGTPLYMSPEQIEGKPLDSRSDLYSLGVTAFHMLAGRPPFDGEAAISLAVQHLKNPPPKLDEIRPDLPSEFIGLVERLLEKNPDDRFASPSQLESELLRICSASNTSISEGLVVPLPDVFADATQEEMAKTVRLQLAMGEERRRRKQRSVQWFALTFACLLVFAATYFGVSWNAGQSVIASPSDDLSTVDLEKDVERQFAQAMLVDAPASWIAIEKNFPPDSSELNLLYNVKSWLRLARNHVGRSNFAMAKEPLEKILAASNVPSEFRILAKIEMANVALGESVQEEAYRWCTEAKSEFQTLPENRQTFVVNNVPRSVLPIWNGGTEPQSTE